MSAPSSLGVIKRSVTIDGHRTSFSLEEPFYLEVIRLAEQAQMSFAAFIKAVDAERDPHTNLSSALRLKVLDCLKMELDALRQG